MALILASQSESRKAMLGAAGVPCSTRPARIDEASVKAALLAEGQPPRNIADALAEMKALKVSAMEDEALVIGSDSIVSVNGKVFDKPVDRAGAAHHLRAFSGEEMLLNSAVVVAQAGAVDWRHVGQARLQVRVLSASFIDSYLDCEWPAIAGCVGCFRIEGPGVQLFSEIKGDYFTILGMPLLPLLGYLRERGQLTS